MNGENEGNYLYYSLLAAQKGIRKTMGQDGYHQLLKDNSVSLNKKNKNKNKQKTVIVNVHIKTK